MARRAARSQARGFLSDRTRGGDEGSSPNVQQWQLSNDDCYYALLEAVIRRAKADLAAPTARYSGGRLPTEREQQQAAHFLGELYYSGCRRTNGG